MKITPPALVDIEIDKLTNSIEDTTTGERLETNVLPAALADLKITTKKAGWLFNWRLEARHPQRTVYKLTLVEQPGQVQGLVSLEDRGDHHYMHLIESAPFNLGQGKRYVGVPGNLVAYACKLAFERGHEGSLAFVSKTALLTHYEKHWAPFILAAT